MHHLSVRTAMLDDAAEIACLCRELGYQSTREEIQDRFSSLQESQDHFIAVVEGQAGTLLGWIATERRLLLESGERAEIVGLVVDRSAKRQGIGRILVEAAEKWARQKGLLRITVRSNIAREDSHPFYQRMGYARQKTQHAYAKQLA